MPPLPSELRSHLERTVIAARDAAETAARASLTALAVARDAPFPAMAETQRQLRRGLRAKARQLGGGDQTTGIPLLVDEIAYQQWHRMLFARFLAENGLLMHPEGVAVTLAECAELAPDEGAADAWDLASRYAALMLPGLFPVDEPAVQVRLAAEHRLALERLLDGLPAAVFTSDDGLGWVYQFWQSKRKEEVNRSERKIGGADLAPVTQLFTEDYMVRFLLHNSLGAWWAARHPDSPLLQQFGYLRWVGEAGELAELAEQADGQSRANPPPLTIHHSPFTINHSPPRLPAAGAFPHWPDAVAQVTMLDPCGGSGHFVVAALSMFVPMRMEEEGLSEQEAVAAALRDNLFMLDIDPRCCQIATFNLLLAAWKLAGYRSLPTPHIACSGIAVQGQLSDWLRLAGDPSSGSGQAVRLQTSLTRLHGLLQDAPTLGSLIDPAHVPLDERLFSADYDAVLPVLERALSRERRADDPAAAVLGEAAEGALRAARLLGRQYTLVATNVPYLARGKQGETLRAFCQRHAPEAKNDLATVFLQRCLDFCAAGGTASLVLPQNWLFLGSYRQFRQSILKTSEWNIVVQLGPQAFQIMNWWAANTGLVVISRNTPNDGHKLAGIDVSTNRDPAIKANLLQDCGLLLSTQMRQLLNPDSRIVLEEARHGSLLEAYAVSLQGISPADLAHFGRFFWEVKLSQSWHYWQGSPDKASLFAGRSRVLWWNEDLEQAIQTGMAFVRGESAWSQRGVAIGQMTHLPSTLFAGDRFDTNVAIILPSDQTQVPAIWTYVSSPIFGKAVRQLDKKTNVTNATLVKVPFDLEHWTQIAQQRYPDGLPEPWSNDPTQWLFNGHPVGATEPLHVAVARLLGYRWPAQQPSPPAPLPEGEGSQSDDGLDAFADRDGIVCLAAVAGEQPAASRLRELLAHAYSHPPALPDFERYRVGDFVPTTPVPPDAGWSVQTQERLLAHAGYAGRSLEAWLAEGFFEQHCRLFHNRPFLWQVWDGRKDGFQALVNYHKLNAALLDKLIYTYLGAWISDQRAERDAGVAGAEGRLVAALELQKKLVAIREGEPPYDLYVRWKPLAEQSIGWNPDLNDGVRLNIRPWVTAGVLRKRFTIHWNKDRGKNPDGSERINDLHFTRAEKQAAQQRGSNHA